MIEGLEQATVFFTLILALALLVERFLEVVTSVYDVVDSRLDLYHFWSRRAERLRDVLERKLRTLRYVEPQHVAVLLARFDDRFAEGPPAPGTVPVIAGDLVRAATVKVLAKALGVAVGIAMAFSLDLNLVSYAAATGALVPSPAWLQVALTGVAVGLGSGPVHKIIRAIERREKARREGGGR